MSKCEDSQERANRLVLFMMDPQSREGVEKELSSGTIPVEGKDASQVRGPVAISRMRSKMCT